jgi:putative membrane protein
VDQGPEERDAMRRTRLANERTQLAWWRTGLTALAVAIGVGRVVPEIDNSTLEWPYVALGVAFSVYAILMIWYGRARSAAVDRALDEGGWQQPAGWIPLALTALGAVLALATAVLIATA